MKKITSFAFAPMAFIFSTFAVADGFTVSGEAKYQAEGVIMLELLTESQFKNGENSAHGVAVSPGEASNGKVEFSFQNVPAGEYLLQGFQDANGNGELDEGSFGPTEPWVIHGYKPSAWSGPSFDKSKFSVEDDMVGIKIHLKK